MELNDAVDKNLTKTSYSLDDLSDLESKLVLITGHDSKQADEVQVFLQASVCVCVCVYAVAAEPVRPVRFWPTK